jgi:hypothetical protein
MTDKQAINELVRLAHSLVHEEDIKPRVDSPKPIPKRGYRLPEKPETLRAMMKEHGFALGKDGAVYYYQFTPLGYYDYSKPPIKAGSDWQKAIRQNAHIVDNNEQKVASYRKMLDGLIRLGRTLKGKKFTAVDEAVDEALEQYDVEITPYLAKRKLKDKVRAELDSDLRGMRDDIEAGKFDKALGRFKAIENNVFTLINKWKSQVKAFKSRKRMMLGIQKLLGENPAFAVELAMI